MSDDFRAWLLWCWLERDADWLTHVGQSAFEEFLLLTEPISWDLVSPA